MTDYFDNATPVRDACGGVLHFGQEHKESAGALQDNTIFALSWFGVIRLSGEDAVPFMQGQFTNDVKAVNAEKGQLNAWCSAKGRIIASFRLFMWNGAYYLVLPAAQLEAFMQRLRMYVLRAKVTLEDVSGEFHCVGLSGPKSDSMLEHCGIAGAPRESHQVSAGETGFVCAMPGSHKRYLLLLQTESARNVWDCALSEHFIQAGFNAWQFVEINNGLPQVTTETSDAFVPQMLNFQALGGLSFKKGCYTGQEVVARMQYLGTLKRHMHIIHANSGETGLSPGDPVYQSGHDGAVGKLVNVQHNPQGGDTGLAVIRDDSVAGDLRAANPQGPALTLQAVPYSIDLA